MSQRIIIDILGWIGSVLVVAAYALNISGRLHSNSTFYLWANLVGSVCLIVNTLFHDAIPSAVVNIVWVGIAIWGMVKRGKESKLS
ncbi:CBU_0592 family membrane protein [Runella sp.]|uniref:CBU_0592 family membrane protein n=1 Tax=Runella sp. TaxID=1960881 RepID=UPI003D103554